MKFTYQVTIEVDDGEEVPTETEHDTIAEQLTNAAHNIAQRVLSVPRDKVNVDVVLVSALDPIDIES